MKRLRLWYQGGFTRYGFSSTMRVRCCQPAIRYVSRCRRVIGRWSGRPRRRPLWRFWAAHSICRGAPPKLPLRPPRAIHALPLLPDPEMAPPEQSTVIRPGVVRIDRIGLELGAERKSTFHIEEEDPLSAV